jgi:DNA-binding transcriptional MerR regulator
MDFSSSQNSRKLLTLKDAAQLLGVSIDSLIQWNDFNILKPTITLNGEVGYTQDQIDKFISIQNLSRETIVENIPQVYSQANTLLADNAEAPKTYVTEKDN